ncbi:MAG: response regulator [Bacteroidaceae bacterium]|nr:response regulator [Bacteroidaceae bacterium]
MAQYGTIVVVDDNPAILTALRICLDSTFERVITLASPDSLPATLQQEKVSIVLMDMNFTLGMNTGQEGLTWLRTLRHLHPQLPVVLITAYADVQLAVKCLKAGASDFVTKPWDNDELLRTLKDAVDKGQEIQSLDELERNHVKHVVDHCHGNISRAAELLGITRQTLYAKLHRP